jgi:NitT/TauT family transport system substrate-binding protein
MTKKIIKTTIFIALAALVLNLAGCGKEKVVSEQKEMKTVKIAYLPIVHALPLYVENELGKDKFKNTKIELVKFGSWPELMDALNTGKVDGASVLIELAMKAKEQGIDLKAVALGHRDGNAVVVSQDINKTADLKGKTFAIPPRLSTHNILLYQILKDAGMTFSDVNVVELPPPEMPAALAEGRVSGYVVAEPFGAKSVANGKGKVLYQSEEIWKNSVCCGLVLRQEFIENNTIAAQELINEYISAGEYIDAEGEKVQEISKLYMKVEQKVLDLSMKWISYKDLEIHENDYEDLRKYLLDMGLSKNPPAYKDFVDNRLFEKVK